MLSFTPLPRSVALVCRGHMPRSLCRAQTHPRPHVFYPLEYPTTPLARTASIYDYISRLYCFPPFGIEEKERKAPVETIPIDLDIKPVLEVLFHSKFDDAALAFTDLFEKAHHKGNTSRKIAQVLVAILSELIVAKRTDLVRFFLEALKARGLNMPAIDYSRILRHACEENLRGPALDLFEAMPSIVSRRRAVDYVVLLEAISRNADWGGYPLAKSILDYLTTESFPESELLSPVYNIVISMASAANKYRDVLKLFRDMSFAKVPMTAETFRLVLPPTLRRTFYSQADLGLISRELKANPVGDELTIGVQLIRFLVHTRNFTVAGEIYAELKERQFRIPRETYLDLIDLAIMDKQFNRVEPLFVEMVNRVPNPLVDLRIVKFLHRFLERGEGESAAKLLDVFVSHGLYLTVRQVRSIMKLFSDHKLYDAALQLGDTYLYRLDGDARVSIANVILFVLLDKKDPDAVIRKSHQIFRLHQFRPSVQTYDAILLAFCRLDKLDHAKETLVKMVPEGCTPNLYHYTILMDAALVKAGFAETFAIFDSMKSQGVKPDLLLYNKLLVFCARVNEIQKAVSLFEEMKANGIAPNSETIEIFLFRYVSGKAGDRGPIPKIGKELLMELGSAALQLDSIDPAAHNQLLVLMASGGHGVEAKAYLVSMKRKGLKPLPATFEFLQERGVA